MAKDARVAEALAWLDKKGSDKTRVEAQVRYGITAAKSYGVKMGDVQALAKALGRDHDLAAELWATGWYEARLLCAYVDDPAKVTVAQMNRWAKDFDNWGICDTVCFKLFDNVPGVWSRIEPWSKAKGEYEKRTAFALMACMALHGQASDAQLLKGLSLCEKQATDERNFVRKSVSWALRSIGMRSKALHAATSKVAERLAAEEDKTARAIGKEALRDLRKSKERLNDEIGHPKVGDFCWINMLTPQPKEAMEFFGKVLGWTYFEMGNIGHGIRVGGRDVGGLYDLEGPNTPPGTRAHIGVMVKVNSADATVEKVKALGGEAKPAFDVFDAGRMAVCSDPNGAAFDPWEPKSLKGYDVSTNLHGAPSWFESLTTDVARAEAFYTRLFGWQSEAMRTPDGDYITFKQGNDFIAGIMNAPKGMPIDKPAWHTYFTVDKVDETEALAKKLGASICVPSMDIPGVGRFCGIVSPQRVRFNVITYSA